MSDEPESPIQVDARGLHCPMPVIELAKAVEQAATGTIVELVADDPTTKVNVPVWCRMQRQQLVAQDLTGPALVYRVRKVRG